VGQPAAQSQNQAGLPTSVFVQLEELQITFGAAGQTDSSSTNGGTSSNANPNQGGLALNVTA